MSTIKTIKIFLIILIMLTLLESCSTRWTENQKKEFAQKCSQTDTTDNLVFMLTGFKYEEVKNFAVLRIHNGIVIDSFYVHADKNSFDSLRTRYTASIDKPIYVKDSYRFIIPGQKPFVLANMKMIMWAQFTMFSEGYGCVMGDYTIDSVRFEHNSNPDFVKRGFKLEL